MKIAYFVNQYPKVSHSFIRREILAVERQGLEVLRIALRGWDGPLPDEEDQPQLSFDPATLDSKQPLPAISA